MTAPWQPYIEPQPISSAGISLVEAFGKMVQSEWSLHSFELFEALAEIEHTPEGEVPVSAIVQTCARTFQEAVLAGTLQTSARPLDGGEPTALKPLHWEIDNPVPRIASGCLNLEDWSNGLATPTHRIFVDRSDFDTFLASLMTQDEIYDAVGQARKSFTSAPPPQTSPATEKRALPERDRHRRQMAGETVRQAGAKNPQGLAPATEQAPVRAEETILRRPEVLSRIAVSASTLDNLIKAGTFPKQIQLGPRSVGWYESQIAEWIAQRRAASSA